jgi:tetratricopeptide (TPR) repeat protein
LIAEAAAYVHDTEHAEQALELLDGFENLHVLTGVGGIYVGPALRYIALLQATLGRSRESVESLEESLRRARGVSAVAWEARIELDLATVRAERRDIDDRDRAMQHARQAVEIAERIGMSHLEQRARRLAGV